MANPKLKIVTDSKKKTISICNLSTSEFNLIVTGLQMYKGFISASIKRDLIIKRITKSKK